MLLNDGEADGRQFLKPETVAMMMTDQLSDAQKQRSPAAGNFWEMRGWGMGATVYTQSIPQGASAGIQLLVPKSSTPALLTGSV